MELPATQFPATTSVDRLTQYGGQTMATQLSYARPEMPGGTIPRRNPESGATHPALPAVALLIFFAVFMAAIAPLDFSTILQKVFPSPSQTVPHQKAAVWVDSNAGVYYCADSMMFGKTHGQFMTQVNALGHGYQPALGTYCSGPALRVPARAVQHSDVTAPKPAATAGENPFESPQSQLPNP